MKTCMNCGQDRDVCATGLCMPCELEVQAREPPQALKDLRAVWEGNKPANPAQVMLKGLYDKSPQTFLAQLRAAEKEWREVIAKLQPERAPAHQCAPEEDGGSDRIEEVIERLLKEAST